MPESLLAMKACCSIMGISVIGIIIFAFWLLSRDEK